MGVPEPTTDGHASRAIQSQIPSLEVLPSSQVALKNQKKDESVSRSQFITGCSNIPEWLTHEKP
jgi:hypothetical protein